MQPLTTGLSALWDQRRLIISDGSTSAISIRIAEVKHNDETPELVRT